MDLFARSLSQCFPNPLHISHRHNKEEQTSWEECGSAGATAGLQSSFSGGKVQDAIQTHWCCLLASESLFVIA